MNEMRMAHEDAFLRRLRALLSQAATNPIPGVSGEAARAVVAAIDELAEREAERAQTVKALTIATHPPTPGGDERRGPHRSSMANVALLHGVDAGTLEMLLAHCTFRDLATGEVLLTAEHDNKNVYVILSGNVRVHLDDLDGPPYVELSAGECVGEISLFGKTKVTAHVLGNEPARLMVVGQDLLWQLIAQSPELARNLLYTLAHRVGRDNTFLRKSLRLQRESEIHANMDALTGLANRRSMNAFFSACIGECTQQDAPLSLLMIDIDYFKRFNDTYGHVLGDKVLCVVAGILSDHAGKGMATRYGGEEFALVLPGYDIRQACDLANELRLKTREARLPASKDGELIPPITISVGAAQMAAGDTPKSLILAADTALYNAKRNGRDCVMTHDMAAPPDPGPRFNTELGRDDKDGGGGDLRRSS